jgi:hypothetical protein
MRLLFLCSSLEPGRDGVGDYTRRLAQECAKLGHACALIALNDGHVAAPVESVEPDDLATLRLPPGAEISSAVAFRERFAPDWISLQLVAYGLHPKGVLFAAIPGLRALTSRVPLHLMLHELWLGNDAVPHLRHRLVGWLQKASLRRLLSTLRPALVSTTNPVYAALLKTIGVEAKIIPLFGNIPIAPDESLPEDIADRLRPRPDWIGLFFGGLYREWRPEPFFGRLARAARMAGRSVGLVQLGNAGGEGDAIWSELERDYASTFNFVRLGPQPAAIVSAVMQQADFGIAASPWSVIGKSGAAAVMLDHGLPVIVTRDDFQPRITAALPPTTDPLVHRDGEALEAELAAGLPKRAPHARAPEIAAAWTKQLATRMESHP